MFCQFLDCVPEFDEPEQDLFGTMVLAFLFFRIGNNKTFLTTPIFLVGCSIIIVIYGLLLYGKKKCRNTVSSRKKETVFE